MAVDKDSIIKRFIKCAYDSTGEGPINEREKEAWIGFDWNSAGPFTPEEAAYMRSLWSKDG